MVPAAPARRATRRWEIWRAPRDGVRIFMDMEDAMWGEPLRARARDDEAGPGRFLLEALDGAGRVIGACPVATGYDERGPACFVGTMAFPDRAGSPQQRQRALVLMARAGIAAAAERGIVSVQTAAPERMWPLCELFFRAPGAVRALADGSRLAQFSAPLHELQTAMQASTAADGSVSATLSNTTAALAEDAAATTAGG